MEKLNNLLGFSDFEKTWKPEEQKKTKRTEIGLDIIKESMIQKVAKLIPYTYHGTFGAKSQTVYVDADHKHPDPVKMMIWGWNEKGEDVSDFKRYFEKKGKTIEVPYFVPSKGLTSNMEKIIKIDAIKSYIDTYPRPESIKESSSDSKTKAESHGAKKFEKQVGQILEYDNGSYIIELDMWVPLKNGSISYKPIKSCNGFQIKFEKNGITHFSVWRGSTNLEDRITSLKRAEEICNEMK